MTSTGINIDAVHANRAAALARLNGRSLNPDTMRVLQTIIRTPGICTATIRARVGDMPSPVLSKTLANLRTAGYIGNAGERGASMWHATSRGHAKAYPGGNAPAHTSALHATDAAAVRGQLMGQPNGGRDGQKSPERMLVEEQLQFAGAKGRTVEMLARATELDEATLNKVLANIAAAGKGDSYTLGKQRFWRLFSAVVKDTQPQAPRETPVRNSTTSGHYTATELRPYQGRPGAMDAFALPSVVNCVAVPRQAPSSMCTGNGTPMPCAHGGQTRFTK